MGSSRTKICGLDLDLGLDLDFAIEHLWPWPYLTETVIREAQNWCFHGSKPPAKKSRLFA